ncbi:Citrate synthase 3, peroxisomal [Hibiscus syriacus]|uniref:Citrate synthase n=1 Tax=Hibiscus syriacus TaxID=106335 RepID=A0A6A3D5N4_HIBSY|nr:Citrate synthase 3, peroxisomal [Hibiscus syriacus]
MNVYGNLPSEGQLADWEFAVTQHSAVPQGILDIIQSMPHDAHPMGVLVSAMSALSVFHPDANPALRAPTIAAAAYLRMAGRPPVLPSNNLSYSENFLYMLDSMGNRSYKPNPRLAIVLDILFVLHAEHEMNCSTAAARHLASGGVDVYTALAGAVGALYGPLHGGANELFVPVVPEILFSHLFNFYLFLVVIGWLKMLSEIGSVENIPVFIEGVKNRKRKMSGFGHRVYKNYDPRAKVIKKLAEEVFSIVGRDPLIEVAISLEKAALSDEYFIKRKLYPNVDFYSGLIYRAMGFPPEFFTVLFAIPRMAGYLAHWRESLDDPDTKIIRPQQVYTGVWLWHYMPLKERMSSTEADKLAQLPLFEWDFARWVMHYLIWRSWQQNSGQSCRVLIFQSRGNDAELAKELQILRVGLWEEYRKVERFWHQKSRIKWISEGDRNTSFFHMFESTRRNCNLISSLMVNGAVLDDPDSFKLAVQSHFKEAFNVKSTLAVHQLRLPFKKLQLEEASMLEFKFTEQENFQALRNSDGNRAPGPNGFNFNFLKKFWPDFKSYILAFF